MRLHAHRPTRLALSSRPHARAAHPRALACASRSPQVRDTLCSLMPPHWDEQLLLASDHAERMRGGIVAARAYGSGLTDNLVLTYMRQVSEQVRSLCWPNLWRRRP